MTSKIRISACLMGRPVRYDGSAKPLLHEAVARWREEGRLVTVCPELASGFAVPRPPAEIGRAMNGGDVLDGTAQVVEADGSACRPALSRGRAARSRWRARTAAATRC